MYQRPLLNQFGEWNDRYYIIVKPIKMLRAVVYGICERFEQAIVEGFGKALR